MRAGAGRRALHTRCVFHTREQQGPTAQHTGLRSGSQGHLGGLGEKGHACVCASGPFVIYPKPSQRC